MPWRWLCFAQALPDSSSFFFYLLVVWIVGRRGLHEPFSWQQFGVDLCFLAGGLGFLAYALLFVRFGQDSHDITLPVDVAQGPTAAMIALEASSVAIVICVVGILLAVRFLYRPDRSTLAGWLTFGAAESKREKGPS